MNKFKKVLIGLFCLIPAFLMYACGQVRPTSIEFEEKEVFLLVGESILLSPVISPVEASNDLVTYNVSDKNKAFIVDNKTLFALAPGDVIVTATTSNGLSAAMKVSVVKNKTKLKTPSNLAFENDVNQIVWSSALDINRYEVSITKNDKTETFIVNENKFSFSDLESDIEYRVKVKALTNIQNNSVYLDSDYSTEYKFVKLSAPKDFVYDLSERKISFSEIIYGKYNISYVLKINDSEEILSTNEFSFNPSEEGEFFISLYATVLDTNLNIFSSNNQTMKITKLKTPKIENDGSYIVSSTDEVATLKMFIDQVALTSFKVAHSYFVEPRAYEISAIVTKNSNENFYYIPSEVASFSVNKMATPKNFKIEAKPDKKMELSWDSVLNASSYTVFLNGILFQNCVETNLVFNQIVGSSIFEVVANGEQVDSVLNIPSSKSTLHVVKESQIEIEYNKFEGKVNFKVPQNLTEGSSLKFVGKVDNKVVFTQILPFPTTKNFIEIGTDLGISNNDYVFSAEVVGKTDKNIIYLNSDISTLSIGKLGKPEVSVVERTENSIKLSWPEVLGAEIFDIYVNNLEYEAEIIFINNIYSVVIENIEVGQTRIDIQSKTNSSRYLDSSYQSVSITKVQKPFLSFNNNIQTSSSIGIKWNKIQLESEQQTETIFYEVYVDGVKKDSSGITNVGNDFYFTVSDLTSPNTNYEIYVIAKSTSDFVLQSQSSSIFVTKSQSVSNFKHTTVNFEDSLDSFIEFNDIGNAKYILSLTFNGVTTDFDEFTISGGKVVFALGKTDDVFSQVGSYSITVLVTQSGKLSTISDEFVIERVDTVAQDSIAFSDDKKTVSWLNIPNVMIYEVFVNDKIFEVQTNSFDFSNFSAVGKYTFKVRAKSSLDNTILGSFSSTEKDLYVTSTLADSSLTFDKSNNILKMTISDQRAYDVVFKINEKEYEFEIIDEFYMDGVFVYRFIILDLDNFEEFNNAGKYDVSVVVKVGKFSSYLIASEVEIPELDFYGVYEGTSYYTLVSNSISNNVKIVKLETPTELSHNLNYDRIEWKPVDGVTSYRVEISIRGSVVVYTSELNYINLSAIEDLSVGGNYSFVVVANSSDLNTLSSEKSQSKVFTKKAKLETPEILDFKYDEETSRYVLTFKEVDKATSYKIYVNGLSFASSSEGSYSFSDYVFSAGENTVSVQALITSSEINISEISQSLKVNKKTKVQSLSISETILSISASQEAYRLDGYSKIEINSTLDLSLFPYAKIYIREKASESLSGDVFEMSSEWAIFDTNRLDSPKITYENQKIVWKSVDNAISYDVYVNNVIYQSGIEENEFTLNFDQSGVYSISVVANALIGDGLNGIYNISSLKSNIISITMLNDDFNLEYRISAEGEIIISFNKIENCDYYNIIVNDSQPLKIEDNSAIVEVNLGKIEMGTRYTIKVKAVKEDSSNNIGNTAESEQIEIYKIETPVLEYSSTEVSDKITVSNYLNYVQNNFKLFAKYDSNDAFVFSGELEISKNWTDFSKLRIYATFEEQSDIYINSEDAQIKIQRLSSVSGYSFTEESDGEYLNWTASLNAKEYVVKLTYNINGNLATVILGKNTQNKFKVPTNLVSSDLTFKVVALANSGTYFNSLETAVFAKKVSQPILEKLVSENGNFISDKNTYDDGIKTFVSVENSNGQIDVFEMNGSFEINDDVILSKAKVFAKFTKTQGDVYVLKSNEILLSDVFSRLSNITNVNISDVGNKIILEWSEVPNATVYEILIYQKNISGDYELSKTLKTSSSSIEVSKEISVGNLKIVIRAFPTETNDNFFSSLAKEVLARKLETPVLTYSSLDDKNKIINTTSYNDNVKIYAKYGDETLVFVSNSVEIPDSWVDLDKVFVYAVYQGTSTSFIEIGSDRILGLDVSRISPASGVNLSINANKNLFIVWNSVEHASYYRVKIYNGSTLIIDSEKIFDTNFEVLASSLSQSGNLTVKIFAYANDTENFNSIYSSKDFTKLEQPSVEYLTSSNGVFANFIEISNFENYDSKTFVYAIYDDGINAPETIVCKKITEIPDSWLDLSYVRVFASSNETDFVVLSSEVLTLNINRVNVPSNIKVNQSSGKTTITWGIVPNASSYLIEIYKDGVLIENGIKVCEENNLNLGSEVSDGVITVKLRAMGGNSMFNSFQTQIEIVRLETPNIEYSSDDEKNYITVSNYMFFQTKYSNKAVIYIQYSTENEIVLTGDKFTIPETWTDLSLARIYVVHEGDDSIVYIPSNNIILSNEISRLETPNNFKIFEDNLSVQLSWDDISNVKKYILEITNKDGITTEKIDNITDNYVDIKGKIAENCTFTLKAISNSGQNFNSTIKINHIMKLDDPTFECSSDDDNNYIKLTKVYSAGVSVFAVYDFVRHEIRLNEKFAVPDAWTDLSRLKIFATCTSQEQTNLIISSNFVDANVERIEKPENISISENEYTHVSWSQNNDASGYIVYIYQNDMLIFTSEKQFENTFDLTSISVPHGKITIKVRAIGKSQNEFNSLTNEIETSKLETPTFSYLSGDNANSIKILSEVLLKYTPETQGIFIKYDNLTPIRINTNEYMVGENVIFEVPDSWNDLSLVKVYAQVYAGREVFVSSTPTFFKISKIESVSNVKLTYDSRTTQTTLSWEYDFNKHNDFLVSVYQNNVLVFETKTSKQKYFLLTDEIASGDLTFKVRALATSDKFNSVSMEIDAYKLETPVISYSSDENGNYVTVVNKEYFDSKNSELYLMYNNTNPILFGTDKIIISDDFENLDKISVFGISSDLSPEKFIIKSENAKVENISRLDNVDNVEIDKTIQHETFIRWDETSNVYSYRVDFFDSNGNNIYSNINVKTNELKIDNTIPSGAMTFVVRALAVSGEYFNSFKSSVLNILRLEAPELEYVANNGGNYLKIKNKEAYPENVEVYVKIGDRESVIFSKTLEHFEIDDNVDLSKVKVYAYVKSETEENKNIISSKISTIEVERIDTVEKTSVSFSENENETFLNWDAVENASHYLISVYKDDILLFEYTSEENIWKLTNEIQSGKLVFRIRAIGLLNAHFNSLPTDISATKLENDLELVEIDGYLAWNKTNEVGAVLYRVIVENENRDVSLDVFRQLLDGIQGQIEAKIRIMGDTQQNYISSDIKTKEFIKLHKVNNFGVQNGEFVFETNEFNDSLNAEYYIEINGKQYEATESGLLLAYREMVEDKVYGAKMIVKKEGCLSSDYSNSIDVKKLIQAFESEYGFFSNSDKTENYLHWESSDKIDTVKVIFESPTSKGTFLNERFTIDDTNIESFDTSSFITDFVYEVYEVNNSGFRSLLNSVDQKTIKVGYSEDKTVYTFIYRDSNYNLRSIIVYITNGIPNNNNFTIEGEFAYFKVSESVYNGFVGVTGEVDDIKNVGEYYEFSWIKKLTWTKSDSAIKYEIDQKFTYTNSFALYFKASFDDETNLYYFNYKLPVDFAGGKWNIYMQRYGGAEKDNDVNFINSDLSKVISFTKIITPSLTVSKGVLSWNEVYGATEYLVLHKDEVVYRGKANNFELGSKWADAINDAEWTFSIMAIGNVDEQGIFAGENTPIFVSSNTQDKKAKKARVLGEIKVENGALVWDSGSDDENPDYTFNDSRSNAEIEIQFIYGGVVVVSINTKITLGYPNNISNDFLDKFYSVKKNLEENKSYTIRYREIGDSVSVLSSEYKTSTKTFKLANSTKNITISNGKLIWNSVSFDDYSEEDVVYDIFAKEGSVYRYIYSTSMNSVNINLIRNEIKPKTNALVISTRGDNSNYLNGHFTSDLNVKVINDKTSLSIKDGYISWTEVSEAAGYEILIKDLNNVEIGKKVFNGKGPQVWSMEDAVNEVFTYPAGNYYLAIKVLAESGQNNFFPIDSDYSKNQEIVKLSSPQMKIVDGAITWSAVENATGYKISYLNIDGEEVTIETRSLMFEPEADFVSGNIYIQALGSNGLVGNKYYVVSNKTFISTTRTISDIDNVKVSNNNVEWTSSAEGETYIVTVTGKNEAGNEVYLRQSTTSKKLSLLDFNLEGGQYYVNIRAKGISGQVSSCPVGNIEFNVLSKALNVSMNGGYLVWSQEENTVDKYSIRIYVDGNSRYDYTYVVDVVQNKILTLNGEKYIGQSVFTKKDGFYKFWSFEAEVYSDALNFIQAQYTVEITSVSKDEILYELKDKTKKVSIYDFKTKTFDFYQQVIGSENKKLEKNEIVLTFFNNEDQIGEKILFSDFVEVPNNANQITFSFDLEGLVPNPPTIPYYQKYFFTWSYGNENAEIICSRKSKVANIVMKYPDITTTLAFEYEENKLTWRNTSSNVKYVLEVKRLITKSAYINAPIGTYTFIGFVKFDSEKGEYVSTPFDSATHVYVFEYIENRNQSWFVLTNDVISVRVQCLPDEGDNLSNRFMSNFSSPYLNEVPKAVSNIKYSNGKISWDSSESAGASYLLTYKLNSEIKTKFTGTKNYFDFEEIGVYSQIKVNAIKSQQKVSKDGTFAQNGGISNDSTNGYFLNFDLFDSGLGTVSNPYVINNEAQLRAIDYYPNACYKLGANIGSVASPLEIKYTGNPTNGYKNTMLGVSSLFRGKLDGNGYTIFMSIEVNVDLSSQEEVGLFQKAQNATFIGVNIVVSSISISLVSQNNFYVGLIAGKVYNTTFTDCTFKNKNGNTISKISDLGNFGTSVIYPNTPAYGRILLSPMPN